jgi:outer membrane protein assembly factor BamA
MVELRFEGVDGRPLEAVRADFGVTGLAWITDARLSEARRRLSEAYRAAGYYRATVRTRIERGPQPDESRVSVTVNEGPVTRIGRVRVFAPEIDREFAGRFCDELTMTPTLFADGEAACRPIVGAGEQADSRALRTTAEQVTHALRRLGYRNARVGEPAMLPASTSSENEPSVELRFSVLLGPVFEFAFEGNRIATAAELREALRADDERVVDETAIRTMMGRLREYYVRRALWDVRIASRIEESEAGRRRRVVFRIQEGRPVYVRTVSFAGAHAIPYSSLREMLDEQLRVDLPGGGLFYAPTDAESGVADGVQNSEARGARMPLALRPEHTFVPEVYQEAARRIVARYRELGYLDATVELDGMPHREVDELGRPVFDVTFRVVEGAQVRLSAVQFEGNNAVASATLAREAGLLLDGPLSLSAVASARDRITEHYREQGYNYVRVTSNIDRSPDGRNARVRFVLTEGPLVRVTRVEIRGLRAIARNVVYDRLALREGSVFRPSLARESQRRLGELGYFSAVTVSLADPDVESSAKMLLVQVTETGGSIETRAGVSFYELLRGSVQWTRRNVLRSTVSMTASLQVGYVLPILAFFDATLYPTLRSLQWYERFRGRAAMSLQLPPTRVLGTDVRPGVDLSLTRSVDLQFAINAVDLSASTTVRPTRWLTLTPLVDFQVNNLNLFGNLTDILRGLPPAEQLRLSRLLLLPQGTTVLSSTRVTMAIDQRDQVFNPQHGFFLSLMAEFVGVITYFGQQTTDSASTALPPGNTLRGTLSFSGYVSHRNVVTWASNVRLGVNGTFDPCNRVTYPNRQFFLGGADTLRGWLQDSLIPADVLAPPTVNACGVVTHPVTDVTTLLLSQRSADVFVLWRNELRISLGNSGFAASLFVDMGNSWKDLRNVFSVFSLRFSPGIGIRYITPIGPVGLDVGFALPRREFEPLPVLSFSFSSV